MKMTDKRQQMGALLLCGILMASCSQDTEPMLPQNTGMSITVDTGNGDDMTDHSTRSYFERSDRKWSFRFENADQLCVTNQFTQTRGYIFTRQYSNDFNSKSAAPTENVSDWFAFYPLFSVAGAGSVVYPPGHQYDPDNDYSGGYMDLTEQAGTRENISQYYVMSGKMTQAAPGTTRLHFDMKPAVAILHIGNYGGARKLMVKLDKDTYWDGRLYVVDYSSNCDYIIGQTKYQTTILAMQGNGEYYVAVPAGYKLYLTDENDNNLKTTRDDGLEAGKYYDVNCTPEATTHALQVDMENDLITPLLQAGGHGAWADGDEVRLCNMQDGNYICRYQTDVFLSEDARPATLRTDWYCLYPQGTSIDGGLAITYDLSAQSGQLDDFATRYHLMMGTVAGVAAGNIPSHMTVSSQTALLVVDNRASSHNLAVKLADGTYWDGTLSVVIASTGALKLVPGHSTVPVTICAATQTDRLYYLSVPAAVASLTDTEGKALSELISFASGHRYTVVLEQEESGGDNPSEITGEGDFTLYLPTTGYDDVLAGAGLQGWQVGCHACLHNPDTDYMLTAKESNTFVTDKKLSGLSTPSQWFALYPMGTPQGAATWQMNFAGQSGTLQDFVTQYNLMYSLLPGVAVMNVPSWATMESHIAMLEVTNNARESRYITVRRTVDGRYWDGGVKVTCDQTGGTDTPSYSAYPTVICTVEPRSTVYIAVPQGRFDLYDEFDNQLNNPLEGPIDVVNGQKKSVSID